MKVGSIYLITNTVNGKRYVGQTVLAISRRWASHRSNARRDSPILLHRAIKKYSPQSFTVKILCDANSLEDLNNLEVAMIAAHNTLAPNGYNLASGGGNTRVHPDTRAKISQTLKGRPNYLLRGRALSEETKAKLRVTSTGKKHSDETRARISASHRGMTHSAEAKAKIAAANRGRTLSPATRAKISLSLLGNQHTLGYKPTAETKAKLSVASTGRVKSDAERAKISLANVGRPKSAETRAKLSAANKGRPLSPERRAAISAGLRVAYSEGRRTTHNA